MFCGKRITLAPAKKIKLYAEEYDRVIYTIQTDFTPDTVIEVDYERDLKEVELPRTIVLFADSVQDDNGEMTQVRYELCSFIGRKPAAIDDCHLLFDPPFPNLQPVSKIDLRTATNDPSKIAEFEMFKFGHVFFERSMSRVEWMQNVRNQLAVDEAHSLDTFDFKCLTELENEIGEDGVGWFATLFDQIMKKDRASTAVWLLEQCDLDELREIKERFEPIAHKVKRLRQ